MVQILKEEDFNTWVRHHDGLKIVRFCAEWSGPCHIMGPIFADLSVAYGNQASFYEIDVDKSVQLRSELGVTEIPTILFYRKGDLIDFTTGLISRDVLIEKLERAMK